MPKRTRTYESWQMEKLANPARAASYLNATLQDSPELLLLALEKVARASRGGAAEATSADQDLLANGDPERARSTLRSLNHVLHTIGLQLSIARMEERHSSPEPHAASIHAAVHP